MSIEQKYEKLLRAMKQITVISQPVPGRPAMLSLPNWEQGRFKEVLGEEVYNDVVVMHFKEMFDNAIRTAEFAEQIINTKNKPT